MSEQESVSLKFAAIEDVRTFLDGLFVHAPVGLAVFTLAGHCLVVNEAFRALFGSEPPPDYDITKDEIAAELGILDLIKRSFAGETVHIPTFWYDPRDLRSVRVEEGRRVAISMTTFPLQGRSGQVEYVIATYRDQTAEVLEREAAEAERDRLRALIESALDAIVVFDDDGRFLEVNPAALAVFHGTTADLLGRGWAELAGPDADFEALWAGLRDEGRAKGETEVRRCDGAVRAVEYTAIWDFLPGRHLSIFRDVSERKQLERSQRMESIGRLAGGVAHDFNNLLTVINGYADMLLARNVATDPRDAQRLREIRKAGQWAARLTHQLLAFSRRAIAAPEALSLNDVVTEMEEMLHRLIGEDVQLTVTLAPGLGPILADRSQMQQILMNLALNARDAMPTGGSLTVETRETRLDAPYSERHVVVRPGTYVVLTVSDTGVGMDDRTQSRIFEPFFTTKEGKGTGLGLATVYGVVEQSGGHILVYSEVGHGTAFKVFLPRASGVAEKAAAAGTAPMPARGDETVFVVEDQDGVRGYVRAILEENGYRVLDAANGDEALRVATQHPGVIHLLLTDVVLPQRSGTRVEVALRTVRPELRVLYMSGYADDAVVRHGILHGEAAFVQKPFSAAALTQKVREVLDRPATG